nr:LPXTG cell wall anchor domain-containing protein [Microbacterium sp. NC79]
MPATGASVAGWTLTTGLVVAGLGLALVLIGTRRRKHSMIAKRH